MNSSRRSPTSASDRYGGPLENRMRLLLEVARAVRAALPPGMMVGARLSASEWTEGGFIAG